MKTVPRNHTRKVAAIKAAVTGARVYTLANHFAGAEVNPSAAWDDLATYEFARLRDNEDGTYTVHVHSNRWFELSTR